MCFTSVILVLGKWREEVCHDFEISLGYIVNSRPV